MYFLLDIPVIFSRHVSLVSLGILPEARANPTMGLEVRQILQDVTMSYQYLGFV